MSKVVLVTAGSRGIGAASCRMAGAEGYDVAVNYMTSNDAAETIADEIRARGPKAVAVKADVTDEAQVVEIFRVVDR